MEIGNRQQPKRGEELPFCGVLEDARDAGGSTIYSIRDRRGARDWDFRKHCAHEILRQFYEDATEPKPYATEQSTCHLQTNDTYAELRASDEAFITIC